MLKPTSLNRDSSLGVDKAPGILSNTHPAAPHLQDKRFGVRLLEALFKP